MDDPAADPMPDDVPAEKERRSTNLELFVDLAFVFAISQLSVLLASDLSLAGVAKAMLVAWTVWWVWSQFTWLGTSVDLERDGRTIASFLLTLVPVILMATAIPASFGSDGPRFGLAVLAASLWSVMLQGFGAWVQPETRAAWIRYAPLAAIAPIVVGVGGFLSGGARVAAWSVAVLLDVGGALSAGRQTSNRPGVWAINVSHFADRHALFVIIVLGEVLVAVGSAATGEPIDAPRLAAIGGSVLLAAVLWWSYFGFVSSVSEDRFRQGDVVDRGHIARDLYSFGHFPLVAGIACVAVIVEIVVAHPHARLNSDELGLLMFATVLMIGGYLGMRWRIQHRVGRERIVTIGVVGVVVTTLGPRVVGWLVVVTVALVLAGAQAFTTRHMTGVVRRSV